MPLKKGKSREIIAENIREMIKAGHKPKQAIAASLAHARDDRQMMVDGGKVLGSIQQTFGKDEPEEKKQSGGSSTTEQSKAAMENYQSDSAKAIRAKYGGSNYANGGLIGDEPKEYRGMFDLMAQGDQGDVASPKQQDMEKHLAHLIQEDDDSMYMAMGGLVQDGPAGDEPFGNKPSENMDSPSEEPMSEEAGHVAQDGHKPIMGVPKSMALSEEALKALEEKKKKRRFR